MLRIGKITLDGYFNYGNRLQNYALQSFLENYADQVDVLWHLAPETFSICMEDWKWERRMRYACIGKKFERKINEWMHDAIRHYRFKQFDDRYVRTRYISLELEKSSIVEDYDYFIVGSDQVWNFSWSMDVRKDMDKYFLTFAPKQKRIAYAASFGVSDIPENFKVSFAERLNNMAAISVREKRGAEIVKELTGKDVPVLVDPTLLLSAREWEAVNRKPIWFDKTVGTNNYILLYFLGELPRKVRDIIAKLSEEENLRIIELMNEKNIDQYCTDPSEFLWLISHATLIYTDSFHGTVFSILNHKPFVVCDREMKRKTNKMTSRIDTLLDLFHFTDRFGTEDNQWSVSDPFQVDFSEVESILKREYQKSDRFIREALHLRKERSSK